MKSSICSPRQARGLHHQIELNITRLILAVILLAVSLPMARVLLIVLGGDLVG